MVCAKCQKKLKPTSLATPGVKSKKEMYYGSPAGSKSSTSGSKTSSTLGQTGIGKSKLLSSSAKNPYAAYSATCTGVDCVTKIESGRKFCNKCAYRLQSCAICGKKEKKDGAATGVPKVEGAKYTLK
jgi:hypothetical protein